MIRTSLPPPYMGPPFYYPPNTSDPNQVSETGYFPYQIGYSTYQCGGTPKFWWQGQYRPSCGQS